jgi:hypothetical protein
MEGAEKRNKTFGEVQGELLSIERIPDQMLSGFKESVSLIKELLPKLKELNDVGNEFNAQYLLKGFLDTVYSSLMSDRGDEYISTYIIRVAKDQDPKVVGNFWYETIVPQLNEVLEPMGLRISLWFRHIENTGGARFSGHPNVLSLNENKNGAINERENEVDIIIKKIEDPQVSFDPAI